MSRGLSSAIDVHLPSWPWLVQDECMVTLHCPDCDMHLEINDIDIQDIDTEYLVCPLCNTTLEGYETWYS